MPAEVVTYRLTQRSQPVGTYVLRSEVQGTVAHLESRAQFQGPLGKLSITQTSRSHSRGHFSMAFREEQQKRGDNRLFDVQFDRNSGLVTARTGGKGMASVPYFVQYRDPLGMLQELRAVGADFEGGSVPMLGRDVTVQPVGETTLETVLGERRARVFRLHPGGSVLWIDTEEPHVILQMLQRLDGAPVEALLVSIASEESARGRRQSERGNTESRHAEGRGSEARSPEARGGKGRSRGQRRRRRRRS